MSKGAFQTEGIYSANKENFWRYRKLLHKNKWVNVCMVYHFPFFYF